MRTVPDYILVRGRWVMANKGDSAESDMRARLVGCEENKGRRNKRPVLCLYTSTGDENILLSQLSSEQRQHGKPLRLLFRHREGILQRSAIQESLYTVSQRAWTCTQPGDKTRPLCVRLL